MSLTMFAQGLALELIAGGLARGGWAGRARDVILLGLAGGVVAALGHDRDGPPDEDHASRIWPAVL